MSEYTAYPLSWPVGWKRTPSHERVWGQFDGTPDRVRRELLMEVDRLALGKQASTHTIRAFVVVSTNVPLRRDGEPMAGRNEPNDPGVAIYFKRAGKQVCLACDKYDRVWKNMRAIQKTIEALRGIERWGSSQLLDRAFEGFAALPEKTEDSWCEVLGVEPNATMEEVKTAYRAKANIAHPDKGGTVEDFQRIQRAYENARQLLDGGN